MVKYKFIAINGPDKVAFELVDERARQHGNSSSRRWMRGRGKTRSVRFTGPLQVACLGLLFWVLQCHFIASAISIHYHKFAAFLKFGTTLYRIGIGVLAESQQEDTAVSNMRHGGGVVNVWLLVGKVEWSRRRRRRSKSCFRLVWMTRVWLITFVINFKWESKR